MLEAFTRKVQKPRVGGLIRAGPILNIMEGEEAILTYTSATSKWKVLAAFIKEGIANGDRIFYIYPGEDHEMIRRFLKENGVDVSRFEKNGVLYMNTLTEFLFVNGEFDKGKAIRDILNFWGGAEKLGYKHIRHIEDVGDFSFLKGNWQTYVDYWQDPRWYDPKWSINPSSVGIVYKPFIMEITAFNIESMTEKQVAEILQGLGKGTAAHPARFIDLLEHVDLFSRQIGLSHRELLGRKILLEFDPASDYENVIESLVKEATANVEPIFVFTYNKSSIHDRLSRNPSVRFFLMSMSTSTPKFVSANTILLPAHNTGLILDSMMEVLETYANTNLCLVFDYLSDLITSEGQEKAQIFLRCAIDMLSERTTSLFLLNGSAHDPSTVSLVRESFSDQLICGKSGVEVVKIPLLKSGSKHLTYNTF